MPEVKRTTDDESDVERFTSEAVLTTGVEMGWADPVDPREVDFSKRPSFLGKLEFDGAGRPLNPNRTPGMLGDRGNLGKWGVNNAADPLPFVVHGGQRRLFMIIRPSTGQLALAGGMVDPGELASEAAARELREEGGIDLSEHQPHVFFEGYVDDPRNTRNAWIETVGTLWVIDHDPEFQADQRETLGAGFFPANSIDELREFAMPHGGIYASHEEIIIAGMAEIERLNLQPS